MQTDDMPALVAEGDYINGGQTKEAIAAAVQVFHSTEAAEAEAEAAAKLEEDLSEATRNPAAPAAPEAPAASSFDAASAVSAPTADSSVTSATPPVPPSSTPAVTRGAPPSATLATLPVTPAAAGPVQVNNIAMLMVALMQTKHKPL